jgi:hypothetical protein
MTFFLFFLTHLFFGEKKYYIYSTFFGAKRRRPPRNKKGGDISPMGKNPFRVCVRLLTLLFGRKEHFFSNLFLFPLVHLLMVLLLTKCLFYKSIFSV